MIFAAPVYHKRPVKLFAKYYAHKHVRKRHVRKRKPDPRRVFDAIRKPARGADYKGCFLAAVRQVFDITRKSFAGIAFALHAQRDDFAACRLQNRGGLAFGIFRFGKLFDGNFRKARQTLQIFFNGVAVKFFLYFADANYIYFLHYPNPKSVVVHTTAIAKIPKEANI